MYLLFVPIITGIIGASIAEWMVNAHSIAFAWIPLGGITGLLFGFILVVLFEFLFRWYVKLLYGRRDSNQNREQKVKH